MFLGSFPGSHGAVLEGAGPGMGGTFGHLPKQPLPPPGQLGAEGTHVPGVLLSSESQAGAAVSRASSLQGMTDLRQTQRLKRGPSVARTCLDLPSRGLWQPGNQGLPCGWVDPRGEMISHLNPGALEGPSCRCTMRPPTCDTRGGVTMGPVVT